MIARTEVAESQSFREICERFRALEASKSAHEANANFEQAQLIREARARLHVSIRALCEALNLSRQSLSTYRNVAERIPEPVFRELITERRPDGSPVFTWSIIVQLARLEHEKERGELAERIRQGAWHTRRVEEYISDKRTSAFVPSSSTLSDSSDAIHRATPRARVETRMAQGNGSADFTSMVDVTSVRDLAKRIDAIVRRAARNASATSLLILVADVTSHLVTEATQRRVWRQAAIRDLAMARDTLKRCIACVSSAQKAMEEMLAEADARDRRCATVPTDAGPDQGLVPAFPRTHMFSSAE